MYTVSRTLRTFSAAHRLNKGYEGKCRHLHGHSYGACVTLMAAALDHYDFVIDFGDIKKLFDEWLQVNWDHVTLVSECDVTLLEFLKSEAQNYFIIPGRCNTTSEVLAKFLFDQFTAILCEHAERFSGVKLIAVRVSESDFNHAEYCITP